MDPVRPRYVPARIRVSFQGYSEGPVEVSDGARKDDAATRRTFSNHVKVVFLGEFFHEREIFESEPYRSSYWSCVKRCEGARENFNMSCAFGEAFLGRT